MSSQSLAIPSVISMQLDFYYKVFLNFSKKSQQLRTMSKCHFLTAYRHDSSDTEKSVNLLWPARDKQGSFDLFFPILLLLEISTVF
jgi:hypothetical protein